MVSGKTYGDAQSCTTLRRFLWALVFVLYAVGISRKLCLHANSHSVFCETTLRLTVLPASDGVVGADMVATDDDDDNNNNNNNNNNKGSDAKKLLSSSSSSSSSSSTSASASPLSNLDEAWLAANAAVIAEVRGRESSTASAHTGACPAAAAVTMHGTRVISGPNSNAPWRDWSDGEKGEWRKHHRVQAPPRSLDTAPIAALSSDELTWQLRHALHVVGVPPSPKVLVLANDAGRVGGAVRAALAASPDASVSTHAMSSGVVTRQAQASVDIVVSAGWIEHDGTGADGAPRSAHGLWSHVEDVWHMLRPGGKLLLSLPVATSDGTRITFDVPHRVRVFPRELIGGQLTLGWHRLGVVRGRSVYASLPASGPRYWVLLQKDCTLASHAVTG